MFPLLIFLNAVLSFLDLSVDEILQQLDVVLPDEMTTLLHEYVAYIGEFQSQVLLYSGLALTLYMLARAVNSLMRSVKLAYRLEKTGAMYYVYVVLFSLVLLVSLFALLVLLTLNGNVFDWLQQYITLSPGFVFVWRLITYLIGPVYVFFLFTTFYYLASERRFSYRHSMPGALFFLVIWAVATVGFSFYINNMSRYSLLYGSIGAMMILMLWLYLSSVVLIMGGELNCVLAEQLAMRKGKESCNEE